MNKDEIKTKLDALSLPAKLWLHDACNQVADAGEYINRQAERDECEAAGLLEVIKGEDLEEHMEVDAHVMGLVYGDSYFAAVALPNK